MSGPGKDARMRRLFFAFLLLLVSGCANIAVKTEGNRIDKSMVTELRPGVTTREKVLELFGEPQEAEYSEGRERLVYIYREKKVPVYLGLIENETKGKEIITTLEIILDDNRVYSYRFSSSRN